MKYCEDLKSEPGFPGCCTSCHDDNDAGVHDLCVHYGNPDNIDEPTHEICCQVGSWLLAQTLKSKCI